MTSFKFPLMHNNFHPSDIDAVRSLLDTTDIFTQSKNVAKFEALWSEWLGVKHSVFVNSGSSANYLTMRLLKILHGSDWEIIVPSFTWISDIISIIDHGFTPRFVDIDLKNLAADHGQILDCITDKTLAVFLTHAQGFNGLSEELLVALQEKGVLLIEDVCESHGATHRNKKLGSFGEVSNFSFYYAHHMTTIEGGMICTNSDEQYDIIRSLRSHGMVREMSSAETKKNIVERHPNLSPQFIFQYPGLNMRNNEISAVIGISQLSRLDDNIAKRCENFRFFLENIDKTIFFSDYDIVGNSNYAFPVILKEPCIEQRSQLEARMVKGGVEFRKGNVGGGNQLLQPYLSEYSGQYVPDRFRSVDHVHNFGYYVGNYPELSHAKIMELCKILNGV